MKTPLERAIEKAGSQAKLAELVGCTQAAISNYARGRRLPGELAVEIERATGVPRKELRPDLFGRSVA